MVTPTLNIAWIEQARTEIHKAVVGQEEFIDALFIGLLSGGHILVEGLPGLAKTLTIKSFAEALHVDCKRIQCTPDMLPSDITGAMVYNQHTATFSARKGPVFTNIVLADEINRTPAKVQSALMEAMAERQVTIGDATYRLPNPFMVLATQNPVEQEGTYMLPEAQLDRFMMKCFVSYPTKAEEKKILALMARSASPVIRAVCSADDILKARSDIENIHTDEKIVEYILNIVEASRTPQECSSQAVQALAPHIEYGISPRGTIALLRGAKARSALKGRGYVLPEDVQALFLSICEHRVQTTFSAQSMGITPRTVLHTILREIKRP
jgi:MoxR-like ATPase